MSTQNQQVDTMITNNVDVPIVDAVDSAAIKNSVQKAKDAGIPVVAYDRLAQGPDQRLHVVRQHDRRQDAG